MNKDIKAKYDARAQIMKAMAHPSRLFILDELSKGEAVRMRVDRDDRGGHVDSFQTSIIAQKRRYRRGRQTRHSDLLSVESSLCAELFRVCRKCYAGVTWTSNCGC